MLRCFLIIILIFIYPLRSQELNRTIAEINGRVITLHSLMIFVALESSLNSLKTLPNMDDGKEYKQYLSRYIMVNLLAIEADKINLKSKNNEEKINKILVNFKKKFKNDLAYNNFLVSVFVDENYLKKHIEKNVVSEQYLSDKFGSEKAKTKDEDIKLKEKVDGFLKKLMERNNVRFL